MAETVMVTLTPAQALVAESGASYLLFCPTMNFSSGIAESRLDAHDRIMTCAERRHCPYYRSILRPCVSR